MRSERVRAILGVWMPMVIGLWIIVTSVIFYFTANLSPDGVLQQDYESWRLVCSGGVFFVGGVMILSTYGRYKKAREAQGEPAPPAPPAP
ncbi:MAG: hypothetical protein AABX97_06550 [Candidatus Thermoplasmatota archaeon]